MGSADELVTPKKMQKLKCVTNKIFKNLLTKSKPGKEDTVSKDRSKERNDENVSKSKDGRDDKEKENQKGSDEMPQRNEAPKLTPRSISESLDKTRKMLLEKKLKSDEKAQSLKDEAQYRNSAKTASACDSDFDDEDFVVVPGEQAYSCQSNNELVFVSVKQKTNSQSSNDSGFGESSFHDKDEPKVYNLKEDVLTEQMKKLGIANSDKDEKLFNSRSKTSTKIFNDETEESVCESMNNLNLSKSDKCEKIFNSAPDTCDIAGILEELTISESSREKSEERDDREEKKKRHKKDVLVPRGPIRSRDQRSLPGPYQHQINQVNRCMFSGGAVFVQETPDLCAGAPQPLASPPLEEPEPAIEEINVEDCMKQLCAALPIDDQTFSQLIMQSTEQDTILDISSDATLSESDSQVFAQLTGPDVFNTNSVLSNESSQQFSPPYLYEKIADYNISPQQDTLIETIFDGDFNTQLTEEFLQNPLNAPATDLLTPPRSNESRCPSSPYAQFTYADSFTHHSPQSDDFLSHSPHERTYAFTESPVPVDRLTPTICLPEESEDTEDGKLKRRTSTNMSMFKKHMQMLASKYASMPCCKKDKRSPKEVLAEHLDKCSRESRAKMMIGVSKMKPDEVFNLLYFRVLRALEAPGADASVHLALLLLACQRLLAERPQLFLTVQLGLALLSQAAVRCAARPEVTRYLVWCVRRALAARGPSDEGFLFTQTDLAGDNLVGALARLGDAHAACLAALVTRAPGDAPLFDVEHRNTEGYSALHLACQLHNATAGPAATRTVHTLLVHAAVPLTLPDNKAGSTALHCAVVAPGCDLDLVLTLFLDVPSSRRKQLAYCKNAGTKTPIELARSASRTRAGYPQDVFEFLKKCR